MKEAGTFLLGLAALIYIVCYVYVEISYLNLEREQWEQMP